MFGASSCCREDFYSHHIRKQSVILDIRFLLIISIIFFAVSETLKSTLYLSCVGCLRYQVKDTKPLMKANVKI